MLNSSTISSPNAEHPSLLARTAASNNSTSTSTSPSAFASSSFPSASGPSSAPGSHARSYLEALSPPSRRLPLQRTASTISYKPQKPSSLAASVAGSEHDDEDEEEDDEEQHDGDAASRRRRSQSSTRGAGTSSAASSSSTSLRNSLAMSSASSPPEDQTLGVPPSPSTTATTPAVDVSSILLLLDDAAMDEEDKIERVRDRLGLWLEDVEGVKPSPFRLDTVVLDLMHRHREDVNPTGASFPSSPLRRPGSARSFSSQNFHRPWTPSKTTSSASASGLPGSSLGDGASPAAPSSSSSILALGSSAHLGGVPAPPRSSSPGPSGPDPGVIGSGSPRGSPRFWNRTAAAPPAPLSLSSASTHRDSFDSTVGTAGSSSPWGGFNLLASPSTATSASSSFFNHAPSSPRSAVPPAPPSATTPGLPSANTLATSNSSASASSRPTSPSPFNSPRLNVAAVAFKPRSTTPSLSTSPAGSALLSSSASAGGSGISIPARRGDLASTSRRSSSQAILHKNHPVGADDEDEEDEFSPFAAAAAAGRSGAGGDALAAPSSFYGSSAGSSFGEAGGEMAMAAAAGEDDETGLGGGAATPFDVLYSILAGAGAGSASQWTPEHIEEALAAHNWDVEATLAAIVEAGGKPPSSAASRSSASNNLAARSPRAPPTGPSAWASGGGARTSSSGVSVMPRDVFSSYRGGSAAGGGAWSPAASAARARPGLGGPASSPALSSASPSLSPNPSSAFPPSTPTSSTGGASLSSGSGPVGPGRVCRYFLSGDCRRADCRFSHDLSKALCKFWLRGQCLNDPCPFLHDEGVVQALASGMAAGMGVGTVGGSESGAVGGGASQQQQQQHNTDDFPELLPPSGPKAQRSGGIGVGVASGPPAGTPTGPAASDPMRSRWVSAVQRNASSSNSSGSGLPTNSTPMSTVAAMLAASDGSSGSGAIHLQARNAPVTSRPPLGPRTTSSSTNITTTTPSTTSKPPPSRLPLRAPLLLPTLSLSSPHYSTHRAPLLPLIEQRNRCLSRASEAFRSGDGAEARRWSSEGQALNREIAERSGVVARGIVRERLGECRERLMGGGDGVGGGGGAGGSLASNEPGARGLRGLLLAGGLALCLGVAKREALPGNGGASTLSAAERTEILVDLHGLHASEAVEIVEEVLLSLEESSTSNGEADGAGAMRGLVYLAVGMGKHTSAATDRRKTGMRVASGVKQWLGSWGYPHAEVEGVVVVDGLSHW